MHSMTENYGCTNLECKRKKDLLLGFILKCLASFVVSEMEQDDSWYLCIANRKPSHLRPNGRFSPHKYLVWGLASHKGITMAKKERSHLLSNFLMVQTRSPRFLGTKTAHCLRRRCAR